MNTNNKEMNPSHDGGAPDDYDAPLGRIDRRRPPLQPTEVTADIVVHCAAYLGNDRRGAVHTAVSTSDRSPATSHGYHLRRVERNGLDLLALNSAFRTAHDTAGSLAIYIPRSRFTDLVNSWTSDDWDSEAWCKEHDLSVVHVIVHDLFGFWKARREAGVQIIHQDSPEMKTCRRIAYSTWRTGGLVIDRRFRTERRSHRRSA
jgi:hypothetical protein